MNYDEWKLKESELREWLKDHIVRHITTDGKRQRAVRDYFTKSGPSKCFSSTNEDWNRTPIDFKKFIFRSALEQLKADKIVRVDHRGDLHNSTFLVVNDVLDIIAGIKR